MGLPRINELDGIRAILALWVVTSHMFCWCGFADAKVSAHLVFYWTQFMSGSSAVETFMILSGFAISFLLDGRHQNYLEFMTGRFFRIYPVYVFCLFVGLWSTYLVPSILETAHWSTVYFDYARIHYAAERANMGPHLFWHLTLLNGLLPKQILPDSAGTLLPPAWSITLEWQYYLVAPFIALCVRSGVGILALTFISIMGMHHGGPWINSQWAFLPPLLPLFLIGIGSYHLYAWYCVSGQPKSHLLVIPVAALLAFAILTGWHQVPLIIWVCGFGSVFLSGDDLLSRGVAVVRRLLLASSLQRLGRMSYCIYLIHWPILLLCLSVFLHWKPTLSGSSMLVLLIVLGLPFIFFASAILHEYLEMPAMAFGKRLAYKPRKATSPKSPALTSPAETE